MAYYPDLTSCDCVPESTGLGFVAVGWLEPSNDYSKGEVSLAFFDRLCMLLGDPWHPPFASGGFHQCGFCRFTGGGKTSFRNQSVEAWANRTLFVPSKGTLFVTPSNLAHYVDAHGYCPPLEFQNAVMNCPDQQSSDYKRALLSTPAREWLQKLQVHAA